MEDLAKIYFDPKTGFTNLATLYKKQKQAGLNYTHKEVKQFYEEQAVNQVYKKPIKVKKYNKIISHFHQTGEMQGDLMIMKKYSNVNKGYAYLFNCIDIYSRKAWSFPLKHKTPTEIAPCIEKIFKKVPKKNWRSLSFDKGSEFQGAVKKVMDNMGIKRYVVDPNTPNAKNKQAMIERFNYTLWMRLKKYMAKNNTHKYIDVLDDIIYNYNHTEHSSIGHTPEDVFEGKEYPIIEGVDLEDLGGRKFKVGDYVRSIKRRKTFDKKAFTPTFSLTVHKIDRIKNGKYTLSNGKTYYEEELVKAKKGEDLKDVKKKNKTLKREEKIKRENLQEFGTSNLEQFIRSDKRKRKPKKRFDVEGF
jgi:hypothetical protein